MTWRPVVLALALVALCVPLAFAGDIIAMPTGNMVPAQTAQLHYIYWDTDPVGPPGGLVRNYMNIVELHYGVTNRLELDGITVLPQGMDQVTELNAYYTLIPESPAHPSLTVGATNLTGSDWLPSSGRPTGDDRISCFVVGAYNLWVPQGPPSLEHPLLRLHLGAGNNWHEDRLFGGLQMALSPQLGLGAFNYQGQPAYLASYMPWPYLELNAGWDQGTPVYHVGYTKAF